MRKEKTKKIITGLDDERSRNTANLKKKLNIEKHETIGGLDLPEGRELKEVIENSQKITTQQQWYRRRADKLSAAGRRSKKNGGGGPPKFWRRRGGAGGGRGSQGRGKQGFDGVGGAPTNYRRRRADQQKSAARRPQIVGGCGAARPAHGSTRTETCRIFLYL